MVEVDHSPELDELDALIVEWKILHDDFVQAQSQLQLIAQRTAQIFSDNGQTSYTGKSIERLDVLRGHAAHHVTTLQHIRSQKGEAQ